MAAAASRQAFPLGQAHTPLTSIPTLGQALTEGNPNEINYVNSFLQILAQHAKTDKEYEEEEEEEEENNSFQSDEDEDDEDCFDSSPRRNRKRNCRWKDNYPSIKKVRKTESPSKQLKQQRSQKERAHSVSSFFLSHNSPVPASTDYLDLHACPVSPQEEQELMHHLLQPQQREEQAAEKDTSLRSQEAISHSHLSHCMPAPAPLRYPLPLPVIEPMPSPPSSVTEVIIELTPNHSLLLLRG